MSIIDIMSYCVGIRYLLKEEKFFLPDAQVGYDSALYRVAHEIWSAGSSYRADNIGVTTILLVVSGGGVWSLDGNSGAINSAGVLLYGEKSNISIDVTGDMDVYVFCIAAGNQRMLSRYSISPGDFFRCSRLKEDVFALCAEMHKIALSDVSLRQKICNHYLQLLLRMFENDKSPEVCRHDEGVDIVDGVCEYIEANLDVLHEVSDVVKYSGYSQEHLGRLFKKHRGVTTLKYLRQRQMLLARVLIRSSGYKLEHVARYFGFSDAYAFSKTYRRIMGHSPGKERW